MCCAGSCAARCATRNCSAPSEPLMWRLVWATGARDGPGLSGTGARRGADRGDAAAGRDPVPQDAGARPRRSSTRRAAGLKKGDMFDGDTAFTLYDTYGFPLDLTQDALRKSRGISVDVRRHLPMRWRRSSASRRARRGRARAIPPARTSGSALREKLGATEFLGYDTESAEGVVTAVVKEGKGCRHVSRRGRERRDCAEPDAVLCRVWRPGRRYRSS